MSTTPGRSTAGQKRNAAEIFLLVDPVQDYEEPPSIPGAYGSLDATKAALPRMGHRNDRCARRSIRSRCVRCVGDQSSTPTAVPPPHERCPVTIVHETPRQRQRERDEIGP